MFPLRFGLPIMFLTWIAINAVADEADAPLHYALKARIDPVTQHIAVEVTLRVTSPRHKGQVLRFCLNKGMGINHFASDVPASYRFQKNAPSPHQFSPASALLEITVGEDVPSGQAEFGFHYEGEVAKVSGWANELSEEWVELGMYSGWFPVPLDGQTFTYEADYVLPETFKCVGNGTVTLSSGSIQVQSRLPEFDIVVVASPQLKQETVMAGGVAVTICHVRLEALAVEQAQQDLHNILTTYKKWFGEAGRHHLYLVASQRLSGGGYARPGLVVMPGLDRTPELYGYLAHELGHLYWHCASSKTWEDWLNESFAEYSAILAMKEIGMNETADATLISYKEEAATLPPIVGLARNAPDAHATLYHAGPAILHSLSGRIGKAQLFRVFREFRAQPVCNTETFLNTLAQETSAEDADFLRTQLEYGYQGHLNKKNATENAVLEDSPPSR